MAPRKARKFQNLYRNSTTRLPYWDYGNNAAYFVTICTRHMKPYFGCVVDGEVQLTVIGEAARACWLAIPDHFPFVTLDAFVIMPNHVHGIVTICKPGEASKVPIRPVDQRKAEMPSNAFGPQSKNLASIIRGFKVGVTLCARNMELPFAWQHRYHDRIIRDAREYFSVQRYIENNPKKVETHRYGKADERKRFRTQHRHAKQEGTRK